MKDIGKLFDQYGTDKNSSHGYGKYYQQHLPEKINKLMEVGVWQGAGIKAFKDFYDDNGEFHVINHRFGGEIISVEKLNELGIVAHEGRQEDISFLKTIKDIYSVIVDDGSHHSDAQLITFKQMFVNNLETNGLYVCEDVYGHLEGSEGEYWRRGKIGKPEDTIMGIIKRYLNGGTLESELISRAESNLIVSMLGEINIHDDKIIFIKKR